MMETYRGHVRTPADAIKLFEACRLGLLPRVQRRLSEKERQSIGSGSVFVWDEREAGMRRWTDGKSWSASRVSGSFLTYREMEGKRGGGSFVPPPARRTSGKTPESGRGSDEDMDMDGDGPDGYRYKPDGLMKQSFSITTQNGQHLHLISYYARPHANAPDLLQPTTDPALRHIVPAKGMYPESTIHEQPQQGPLPSRDPIQQGYSPQHHPGPLRQPYPYQLPPGYSWPPSPIATPPYAYAHGGYPANLAPPPPGSAHSSPQYHHQPPPHHLTHQQQGPPSAFERAPPPLQNSYLPPPPPSVHQLNPIAGPPQGALPPYPPNPSPRIAQAAAIAEQQARQASAFQIDPRISSIANAAIERSQAASAAEAAQAAQVAAQAAHAEAESRARADRVSSGQITPTSTTTPGIRVESPTRTPGVEKSQAQTIPSIASLVHATDSPTRATMPDSRNNGTGSAHGSRSGSLSPIPKGPIPDHGPKDIPHAKMRFGGEDLRALKVLDRKFCI